MMAVEKYQALSNVDSEAALCGSLMLENSKIDAVADQLAPEDFSEPLLADIYAVIVREAALGRPANPITLRPYLVDHPAIEDAGGITYLNRLAANNQSSWSNPVELARQIKALSMRRALVSGLNAASALAADPSETNESVIECTESALAAATETRDSANEMSAAQALDRMLASYDEPRGGVTCDRIASADRLLGPICPTHLVIEAGRPGMGKTAFAISYSIGAALKGHGVLFITLEMSSDELAARAASDLCFDGHKGIPFEAIRDGRLTVDQRRAVMRARDQIEEAPFRIVDVGTLTISRLNMMVRRYKRRMAAAGHKLELVVIDYLQLLTADGKPTNRTEAVSAISRGLKALAKDHKVGVLALAQLSRQVEQRDDKRPQLSDLRESGQIEQDADAVLFLYRHEYYLKQSEPDEGSPKFDGWRYALDECQGRLELILAKGRHRGVGKAQAVFWAGNQAVRG